MRSAKFIMNYILGIVLLTQMPVTALKQALAGMDYTTMFPILSCLSMGIGIGILIWNTIIYGGMNDEAYTLARNELEALLKQKRAEIAKDALRDKEEE